MQPVTEPNTGTPYMIQGSDEERCKHDGEREMFWHYDYEQAIMVQRIYCKICGKLIYTNEDRTQRMTTNPRKTILDAPERR